jgi:hypothetical protein
MPNLSVLSVEKKGRADYASEANFLFAAPTLLDSFWQFWPIG